MDELYVTTAYIGSEETKPSDLAAGAIYRVTGLEVKGVPAVNFRLTV